ncbi:hypothetical protein CH275_19265 [Rhodococcus sp. 06-235-1A]|uniref:hypothetical protein n=1 Tax=Rhodococcus sp. 06-235-1A TaxID=2022508 RepID=UPI000B9A2199|nr:hypothetical protein [Rhodococcus sp. 06-235-1A]OZD00929.1 hypothetical protein CH275_19265 [Rhodococcus sp. 06-235-1A]
MTPDRWGYKLLGFPEFGTDFHLVGSLLDATKAVVDHNSAPIVEAAENITIAVVVHEDDFL